MTVDPLTVLREAVAETRKRYGFPDIEERYSAALVDGLFLRDLVAALAAVEQLVADMRTLVSDDFRCLPDCIEGPPTCGCEQRVARAALARFEGDSQPEGER